MKKKWTADPSSAPAETEPSFVPRLRPSTSEREMHRQPVRRAQLFFLWTLFLTISAFCSGAPATAMTVPPELAPWVPWIQERYPEIHCPVVAETAACIWPGVLELNLSSTGGNFLQRVHVDRAIAVPLAGGAGMWPQQVTVDGRAAVVLDQGGFPMVYLTPGSHVLSGEYGWATLPGSIHVPPFAGIVRLTLDGKPMPFPQLGTDGTLRLSAGEVGGREENRLEIEVARRINDGIPTEVVTRISLRAAGTAREVNLGRVLLAGTRPVALDADLPTRLNDAGELVIQLRPGTFTVTVGSIHDGPVVSLTSPTLPAPWPEQEYWGVAQDEAVRSIRLSGPPGMDPARTSVPDDWKTLPTFLLAPGTVLSLEELRRGEPQPPPNRLDLKREFWLDLDGDGYSIRDNFTGSMTQAWRLNMLGPAVLGHASINGEDQVITKAPGNAGGGAGIEARDQTLQVTAESRVSGGVRTLPAVGWDTEVTSLGINLYLPPGWRLAAVGGVDGTTDSLFDLWTLFDLFFVLIIALTVSRLAGRLWGGVALLALVLTRHMGGMAAESSAPEWTWAILLILLALLKVAPEGWMRRGIEWLRWGTLAVLFVLLADFSVDHVRAGLFPVLEYSWQGAQPEGDILSTQNAQIPNYYGGEGGGSAEYVDMPERLSMMAVTRSAAPQKKAEGSFKQAILKQDPAAIVQTGPGIPTWSWNRHHLTWSGPVVPDQELTLWLLGPMANRLLAFLRVALLLALAIRLTLLDGQLKGKIQQILAPAASTTALLVLMLHSPQALGQETPPTAQAPIQQTPAPQAESDANKVANAENNHLPALMQELEQKLIKPPPCAPNCVSVTELEAFALNDRLTLRAEVHVESTSSWPVPGPVSSWSPENLTVDGAISSAMARQKDGFLHVRLDPGVHILRVEGPLPASGALTLQFGLLPHKMRWSGDGWTLDGLRADGTPEQAVKLVRAMTGTAEGANAAGDATRSSENLTPWLEVQRTIELGIPWVAKTVVVRKGPASSPVSIKVPLLPGESVNVAKFQVQGGLVLVTLNRDETAVEWESTLQQTEKLELKAPANMQWIEQWSVACNPMFACIPEGLAPQTHIQEGRWAPVWRVWPGETVSIQVTRPEGVEGQSITIERARLGLNLGQRLAEAKLELAVRSSQGGQVPVEMPEGAKLQSAVINGNTMPLQARGKTVAVPLQPGRQSVVLTWQMPHEFSLLDEMPAVGLGMTAANTEVRVSLPENRWILGLLGPSWGPVPLFWSYVLVILLAAPLLGRMKRTPLSTRQWALLGLGLITLPMPVAAIVVVWFLALSARKNMRFESVWRFDFVQLVLMGWTVATLIVMYGAIHQGLLDDAPSRISGNVSNNTQLNWYIDRIETSTPTPTIISLPLWVWRVIMLSWSLWLASSLLKWLPWAWQCLTVEGILRSPFGRPKGSPVTAPVSASVSAPMSAPAATTMTAPVDREVSTTTPPPSPPDANQTTPPREPEPET